MKNRKDLKSQWVNLVSKYSENEELISNMFNSIKKYYNSPNIYYHNLDHVEKMLLEAKKFKEKVVDYDSMLFAIWFHDIVYNTKRSDNEEKSADYAENFLNKIRYKTDKIKTVRELIMKTKTHQPDATGTNYDTLLFLDLDLLSLGSNPEDYQIYAEKVRKEYNFVPKQIYAEERAKILENFLKRRNIFNIKELQDVYEVNARKNIQAEIDYLKNKI